VARGIRLTVIITLTAILLLLLTGCSTGYTTKKEKTAPDFNLISLDGQTVTLSQFLGKPVFINFWASWCQPCREEMPFLQQTFNNYKDKGLVFLTIDEGEKPDAINKFFKDNGYTMPVLLDSKKTVGPEYQITGVPETFLIDKNGIIRKWQVGAYPNAQAIEDDLRLIMP